MSRIVSTPNHRSSERLLLRACTLWLTAIIVTLNAIAYPVFAQTPGGVQCPEGLSELDCNALLNDAANWVPNTGVSYGCSTAGGDSLVGGANAEKVWNFFTAKGLTPIATAGIMGNFEQEAGFDPARKQNDTTRALPNGGDDKTGYGIAQWTSIGRQAGLFAKIREASLEKYYGAGWGHPEKDKEMPNADNDALLLIELNYAWEGDSTKIKDIAEQLNTAKTHKGDDGSAVLFHKLFERSGDNALQIQERVDSAGDFLDKYGGGENGGTSSSGCVGQLGGVSAIEDAIPWAMRFIQDTKRKYNGAAPAIATIFKNPLGNERIMSLARWPDNSGFNCWGASGCDECVTASGWFVTGMTEYTFGNGNGGEVVGRLGAMGVPTGTEPQPYSIFSYNTGTYGHTGVVLGVLEGGEVVTLENNWPRDTLSVRKYDLKSAHADVKFAYVGDKLKVDLGSMGTDTESDEQ